MALKLSAGLRNFLLGEGNIRKAFEDGILNIYSGAAPANAHFDPRALSNFRRVLFRSIHHPEGEWFSSTSLYEWDLK